MKKIEMEKVLRGARARPASSSRGAGRWTRSSPRRAGTRWRTTGSRWRPSWSTRWRPGWPRS